MSGSKLLIDSNIAIYLSKRILSLNDIAKPGDILFVSLVSYMEVLGYKFVDKAEESFVKALFNSLQLLPVSQHVAERVISYRQIRKIKLPDAIILASAYEFGCTLITRNVDDFADLDIGVTIINPFDTK